MRLTREIPKWAPSRLDGPAADRQLWAIGTPKPDIRVCTSSGSFRLRAAMRPSNCRDRDAPTADVRYPEYRSMFISSLYGRRAAEVELWPSQGEAAARSTDLTDDLVVAPAVLDQRSAEAMSRLIGGEGMNLPAL